MKKMNWEIIEHNIMEARTTLEKLERQIKSQKKPSEYSLQISLAYAYNSLNFAWNIRHEKTKKYAKLSEKNYIKWGKYPKGIEKL